MTASAAGAVAIDEGGEIQLGARAYTAARVGTQDTDIRIVEQAPGRITERSLTFPVSAAGHLRQSRAFVEATWSHNLTRLLKEGFGPLALLRETGLPVRKLGYFLSYRGEYDGVYDYGPAEYRTHFQFDNQRLAPPSPFGPLPNTAYYRQRLRNIASVRNRLFQAYIEADFEDLYLRFGRQILAWGETDVFRLLDNINPLDNSFGGFLVPLDERRVPIDMLRVSYNVGEIPFTPFYEAYIEGFGAIDNAVGFDPGIPTGSPWAPPNTIPSASQLNVIDGPPRTISAMRGGFQFKFISPMPGVEQTTFGFAHYYTYLDNPGVEVFTENFPFPITSGQATGFVARANQTAPKVQITGATAAAAIPPEWARKIFLSSEPIVRTELAYFHNEPRWSQAQLDPFIFALPANGQACPRGVEYGNGVCSGGRRTGDSWNFMLGFDTNQAVRWLNPDASFFISSQFFYKHLRGGIPRRPVVTPAAPLAGQPPIFEGEVLPVTGVTWSPDRWGLATAAAEPDLVHNPVDQYLNTLLIATSYYGGRVTPSVGLLYDWGGAITVQPAVTYLQDPFRFVFSYSYIYAGHLFGSQGISLLRDRDNVLFQVEYSL